MKPNSKEPTIHFFIKNPTETQNLINMSLEQHINDAIKTAMLAKDKEKLEALRAVKSAILLAKTSEGFTGEIKPEDEIKLLQKMVKQRKEAAEIYLAKQRDDLAQAELFQAGIIETFLPEQMSPAEVKKIISGIITELNATGMKDMGKVMQKATQTLAGKADNKLVSGLVKELLAAN